MLKAFVAAVMLSLELTAAAAAQNCPAYTYPLTDGSTAYGSQVMANFTTIRNCANSMLLSTNPSVTGTMFFNPVGSIPPTQIIYMLEGKLV